MSGILALVLVAVVAGSLMLGRDSAAGHIRGSHGQMDQTGQTVQMDHSIAPHPTGSAPQTGQTGHAGIPDPSGQHAPVDATRGH